MVSLVVSCHVLFSSSRCLSLCPAGFTWLGLGYFASEEILVHLPRKAMVSGNYVAAAGISRPIGGVAVEKLRIVRNGDIVSAQLLENGQQR